jgi:hypothetical protein
MTATDHPIFSLFCCTRAVCDYSNLPAKATAHRTEEEDHAESDAAPAAHRTGGGRLVLGFTSETGGERATRAPRGTVQGARRSRHPKQLKNSIHTRLKDPDFFLTPTTTDALCFGFYPRFGCRRRPSLLLRSYCSCWTSGCELY